MQARVNFTANKNLRFNNSYIAKNKTKKQQQQHNNKKQLDNPLHEWYLFPNASYTPKSKPSGVEKDTQIFCFCCSY